MIKSRFSLIFVVLGVIALLFALYTSPSASEEQSGKTITTKKSYVASTSTTITTKQIPSRNAPQIIQDLKTGKVCTVNDAEIRIIATIASIESLIDVITDMKGGFFCHTTALIALGMMGPAAITKVSKLLTHQDDYVRSEAAMVLAIIGGKEADTALRNKYKNYDNILADVKNNYRNLIEDGKPELYWLLMLALIKYGDVAMANDFINCGNSYLSFSALSYYGLIKGYTTKNSDKRPGPRWGGRKR